MIAFILAATRCGPLILNRLDICQTENGYFGVGGQLLMTGSFDQPEIDSLSQLLHRRRQYFGDGVVVVDAGANIGTHTLVWAYLMRDWGCVIAIEAQERVFYALAGNIALQNAFNARAIHAVVGNREGAMTIPFLDHTKPASFGSLELSGTQREFIGQYPVGTETVPMVKIDAMGLSRCDLLKIDVEGMELEALAGAETTVMKHHPVIYVERIKCNDAALREWLTSRGYRLFNSNISYCAVHESDPLVKEISESSTDVERNLDQVSDDIDLLSLKAENLVRQNRFNDAEVIYRDILERHPQHIQSLITLGNIYKSRDDFAAAEAIFTQAEMVDPACRELILSWFTMYNQQGESEKAKALLEPIAGDDDYFLYVLAWLYLEDGDYRRGWKMLRHRHKLDWFNEQYRGFKPFDHYTDVIDKTVVVLPEGGLGDVIQFYRYIPKLAAQAKLVRLVIPHALKRLIQYNMPGNVTIEGGSYPTDVDYIVTDFEMPYVFCTTLDTIPHEPYLSVPESLIAQRRLAPTTKARVGVCWAGGSSIGLNERHYDERRSLELRQLAPLSRIDGIEFISLQYGERSNEHGMPVRRVLDESFDMMDTAAIVAQLDLVISVDTSICHLAGAMGKPTWVLTRYDVDWRWLHNRPDSPWYPRTRIFGQESYRDWSKPLADVEVALRQWVKD